MKALVLFMIAVVVPTFFGSPRSAPMWLSVQALALAGNIAAHHGLHSLYTAAAAVEVLAIRGMAAPWFLRRAARHDEPVDHLLPSNLFAWILGISVALLAFEFAEKATLGSPAPLAAQGEAALTLGAVCATVVLALLLLSFTSTPSVQFFSLLLIENAATLFESGLPEPWPPWLHVVLSSVYVLTFWVGIRLLSQSREEPGAEASRQVL